MRALKMSKRSVYYGKSCLHCHKNIAVGRAFLGSTYYISHGSWVHTQSMKTHMAGLGLWELSAEHAEICVRVTYHRACLERILARGPVDPEIEIAEWESYRAELLERLGVADEAL